MCLTVKAHVNGVHTCFNSNEKTVVLIDEIGHLRIELAEREGKISALSTELADTKVKLAELAITTKPTKK